MKQIMKRAMCLLLIAALLCAAAGCSRQAAEADPEAAETADQSAETAEQATDAPAAQTDAADAGSSTEAASAASEEVAADYAETLFDASYVHTIDVAISDEDWADLRQNPLEKTKYEVSVTIDGETLEQVSFATKGNTSLTAVASDPDSDRYSFKLNFGKFNKGQTYHGLGKLNLNNLYADATCLKDFLSEEIFRQAGVEAPLVSYVWLTINGEAHGLYIAIEDVSESYLARTQDGAGVLYKPETEQLDNVNGGPGNMGEGPEGMTQPGMGGFPGGERPQEGQNAAGAEVMQPPEGMEGMTPPEGMEGMTPPEGMEGMTPPEGMEGMTPPEGMEGMTPPEGMETPPQGGTQPRNGMQQPGRGGPDGDFGGMDHGGMGFGEAANGADLRYTDDELSSYSDIFDNAETDADEADMQRVITALKALGAGDAESSLDTDEVIRYFAAHNFVLNYDSYTGNMLHNYYLYEQDGKLAMLPWDYNLAFGAFSRGGEDATQLVNTGIDTPLSGTSEDARPMWAWIAENETYTAQYHAVYDELLSNYFESGAFEAELDRLYEMLLPYVEQDPTAFYTAEEFTAAVESLRQFCLLRAESIRAQLSGSLDTHTSAQDEAARIDASSLSIPAMGTQNNGPAHEGEGRRGGR